MGQLMGNQRDQRPIAGDDRGRDEGEPGVLHPAQGEAGRQHQDVVASPTIRSEVPFAGGDHCFDVGKFAGGRFEHTGLGPDARAPAQRMKFQVSDGQRNQVRRNRLRHRELKDSFFQLGRLGARLGPHHGPQARGHAIRDVYVTRTPGESCKGIHDRA